MRRYNPLFIQYYNNSDNCKCFLDVVYSSQTVQTRILPFFKDKQLYIFPAGSAGHEEIFNKRHVRLICRGGVKFLRCRAIIGETRISQLLPSKSGYAQIDGE